MEDSLRMGLEVRNAGVAAQSTTLTGSLGPNWTRQTQLHIFLWNLDLPPTGNSSKGLTANGSPATQLDL